MKEENQRYLAAIEESATFLSNQKEPNPQIALVLGSGFKSITEKFEHLRTWSLNEIPNFTVPSVEGHGKRLYLSKLQNTFIWILEGRVHYYEGHDLKDATFPIRVLQRLGVKTLILTNSSGGINPTYKVGDIMILNDHINLMPDNPLRGPNLDNYGPRFPDMSEPYNKSMISVLVEIATANGIDVRQGVYAGVTGPNYETAAEAKYLQYIGADAVGMSTVPETIVAVHGGMSVVGLSCITDIAGYAEEEQLDHADVLKEAEIASDRIGKLITELIQQPNRGA